MRRFYGGECLLVSALAPLLCLAAGAGAGALPDAPDMIVSTGQLPPPKPSPWLPDMPIAAPNSSNPQCAAQSILLEDGIRNRTHWAVRMWEASAHVPVGWLTGTTYQLGDFDECLETNGPIAPQYCLATVTIQVPGTSSETPQLDAPGVDALTRIVTDQSVSDLRTLRWALCTPAACSAQDIAEAVNAALPPQIRVTLDPAHCSRGYPADAPWDAVDIAFVTTAISLTALVILASLLDIRRASCSPFLPANGLTWRLFRCFSLPRNIRLLTNGGRLRRDEGAQESKETRPGAETKLNLGFLDTFRFVALYMIVGDHNVAAAIWGPYSNGPVIWETVSNPLNAVASQGALFVDLFFLVGGLLVVMQQLSRAKHSPFKAILLRYVRLTPTYAVVVFLLASVYWRMGSGPIWAEHAGWDKESCRTLWWTNMLYINNYVNTGNLICAGQTWYLAADMHMFLVTTLVLTPLLRSGGRTRLFGLWLIGAGLVVAILLPFAYTMIYNYPATFFFLPNTMRGENAQSVFMQVYARTHLRMTPYLMGVGLGVWLLAANSREKPLRLSPILSASGAVAGFAVVICTMMLGSTVYTRTDMTPLESGLYACLHRLAFSSGLCISIACLALKVGGGGRAQIQKVPGSESRQPARGPSLTSLLLGRLGYGIYLIHFHLILGVMAYRRQPYHLSKFLPVLESLSYYGFSLIVALVIFLLVEEPCRHFFDELINKREERPAPIKHLDCALQVVTSKGEVLPPTVSASEAASEKMSSVNR